MDQNNTMDTFTCAGCRLTKPIGDFMGVTAKGTAKQFRTCSNCRNRTTEQHQRGKKRQLEAERGEESNGLEIIEPTSLSDHVAELLNAYGENIPTGGKASFNFQYQMGISAFNKSAKEVADELVEFVEDADEFAWV
jgi:hypothetical protein